MREHTREPSESDGAFTEESIKSDEYGLFTVGYASFETYEDARDFVALKRRQNELRDAVVWFERFVNRMQASLDAARADLMQVTEDLSSKQIRDGYDPEDTEDQLLITSLATNLRLTERSVAKDLCAATVHAQVFPNVAKLWRSGEIHMQHVRVFDDVGNGLETDRFAEFEEKVLDQLYAADGRLRTPAQLRRIANRVKKQMQSTPTEEQVARAAEDRGVWTEQQECGMTHLIVKTTPILAEAAYDRLRQVFKLRDSKDIRSMAQFMSDAAMGLLVTGTSQQNDRVVNADISAVVRDKEGEQELGLPVTESSAPDVNVGVAIGTGIVAKVAITMPATLLATGETEDGTPHPELASGVLIDDRTALQLAAGSKSWTRIFTDPVSGVAITADVYEPTASLRRLINARDQSCRFPGCTRPAHRTEHDHTVDWQYGGKTVPDNLACLCKKHHVLKHKLGPNHGWRVRQVRPGYLEWFGPGGEVHSVPPDPVPTWQPPPRVSRVRARQGRAALLDGKISTPPENMPRLRDRRERHPYLDRQIYREREPEEPDNGPLFDIDLFSDGQESFPF